MMALPTTTNGLRARSDRFGGGGTCSGSSAARGLRGEMGGRSLIDTQNPVELVCAQTYDSSSNTAKRWFRHERTSVDNTLNDNGRVGAAESERIGQRDVDLALARRQWHEIDSGFDRRMVQIDGWRRDI